MESRSLALGIAAFVAVALLAIGAVYALADMRGGHQPGGEEAGRGFPGMGWGPGAPQAPGMGGGEEPFHGGPGFQGMGGMGAMDMGSGMGFGMDGFGECMEGFTDVTEVTGRVVEFDADTMTLVVETGDGEKLEVMVAGAYVDTGTGALTFGPWIAASLEEGQEVKLLVAEHPGNGDGHDEGGEDHGAGYGPRGEPRRGWGQGAADAFMAGIEFEGKSYVHPALLMAEYAGYMGGEGEGHGGPSMP